MILAVVCGVVHSAVFVWVGVLIPHALCAAHAVAVTHGKLVYLLSATAVGAVDDDAVTSAPLAGVVSIEVLEAKDLVNRMGFMFKHDPYVKLALVDYSGRVMASYRSATVWKGGSNPNWVAKHDVKDRKGALRYSLPAGRKAIVKVEVWDEDKASAGTCAVRCVLDPCVWGTRSRARPPVTWCSPAGLLCVFAVSLWRRRADRLR